MLCLCHHGPALLRFWFQTDLGAKILFIYLFIYYFPTIKMIKVTSVITGTDKTDRQNAILSTQTKTSPMLGKAKHIMLANVCTVLAVKWVMRKILLLLCNLLQQAWIKHNMEFARNAATATVIHITWLTCSSSLSGLNVAASSREWFVELLMKKKYVTTSNFRWYLLLWREEWSRAFNQ